jgi:glycosyltransferase involved in cell wall biosynthesis
LQDNRIDVVLANYGISAAHLSPICRELNIPLLVIFHGHDATDRKLLRQYKNLYQSLFVNAASVIVVSNDMRERIISIGAKSEKVSVVPCGVDLVKFKPVSIEKERMFLAVGRFVAKKGPINTIKAFHEVWKKYPDVKLIMVGAHNVLYEACAKLVTSLGMKDAVTFPGILKQEEIGQLMGKALAFVQHSVTAPNGDMEGTPVSIMEAGASGLPVISTNHGGIKDAVVHGKTGFLVEEGDVFGMAICMTKILENPDLGEAMGRAGRSHVEIHYDQVKQIEKLYTLAVSAIEN